MFGWLHHMVMKLLQMMMNISHGTCTTKSAERMLWLDNRKLGDTSDLTVDTHVCWCWHWSSKGWRRTKEGPNRWVWLRKVHTLEFLPPLRVDWPDRVRVTSCSGVEGDLEVSDCSEPFSTMLSVSTLCRVGDRQRFRRTGEQAGELRLELLAVLEIERETDMF